MYHVTSIVVVIGVMVISGPLGSYGCSESQFSCQPSRGRVGGSCIPLAWRCDGVSDCVHDDDELNCGVTPTTTTTTTTTTAPRRTTTTTTTPPRRTTITTTTPRRTTTTTTTPPRRTTTTTTTAPPRRTTTCRQDCVDLCESNGEHQCDVICQTSSCSHTCYQHCVRRNGPSAYTQCTQECEITPDVPSIKPCLRFCLHGNMDRQSCNAECQTGAVNYQCILNCQKLNTQQGQGQGHIDACPDTCGQSDDMTSRPVSVCYSDCVRVGGLVNYISCKKDCSLAKHTYYVYTEAYKQCININGRHQYTQCLDETTLPTSTVVNGNCYSDCIKPNTLLNKDQILANQMTSYKSCLEQCKSSP